MPTRFLTPIALLQGLWVKSRTPVLPPARGRRGRCGDAEGPATVIAGVGDSIIAGAGIQHQRDALTGQFARCWHEHSRQPAEWRAHGVNGATSAVILHRIAPHAPAADVYLISAGVNDAVRGIRSTQYAENLHGIVHILREKSPRAIVVFSGLPQLEFFPALPWPLGAVLAQRTRTLQAAVRQIAQHDDAGLLCYDFPPTMSPENFASDGFHPSISACADWASHLLELCLGHSHA
jgi:lysophospholipase L1-like esterase